jgi:hypothetical protein
MAGGLWVPASVLDTAGDVALGVLSLVGLALLYVTPTVIAWVRGHDQFRGIILVNLLFGWTGLGWIVAMLWCTTSIAPGQANPPSWMRRRRSG